MSTVSSFSDAAMKKFGRGFSLDFDALMNEVKRPSQPGDEGGHHRTPAGLDSSTEAGPSTKTYGRFNSHGSEDAISPVVETSSTPTDDGSPDPGGRIIGSGTQTRVSVSRTGRCKNRNRQRLSVLQDEDFFRAAPPPSSSSDAAGKAAVKTPPPPPSSSSTVTASPKASVASAAAAAGEAIDFDSVLNALDKSIQAPASVMATDCYSF